MRERQLSLTGKTALVCAEGDIRLATAVASICVDAEARVAFAAKNYTEASEAVRSVKSQHGAAVIEALGANLFDAGELNALPAAAAETMGGLDVIVAISPAALAEAMKKVLIGLAAAARPVVAPSASVVHIWTDGRDSDSFSPVAESPRTNSLILSATLTRELERGKDRDALAGPLLWLAGDQSFAARGQSLFLDI
ncbi:MAG: hypothetical protein K2H64_12570 [Desulfovibrio sp.]|nr:hypothetical protein [Desulfovibrio sp.]